jgi:hypothetical protein
MPSSLNGFGGALSTRLKETVFLLLLFGSTLEDPAMPILSCLQVRVSVLVTAEQIVCIGNQSAHQTRRKRNCYSLYYFVIQISAQPLVFLATLIKQPLTTILLFIILFYTMLIFFVMDAQTLL